MCHTHFPMVGQADYQCLIGQFTAFYFLIKLFDQKADLSIDYAKEVSVKIKVIGLLRRRMERTKA
ncbi:hypothetical protein D3C87_2073550 [compost metagenome]